VHAVTAVDTADSASTAPARRGLGARA